jgi:hypothetical protein
MRPQKDVPTIDSLHIYLELLWHPTNLQGFFSYEVSNLVRKVFLSSLTWAREEWRGIHQWAKSEKTRTPPFATPNGLLSVDSV